MPPVPPVPGLPAPLPVPPLPPNPPPVDGRRPPVVPPLLPANRPAAPLIMLLNPTVISFGRIPTANCGQVTSDSTRLAGGLPRAIRLPGSLPGYGLPSSESRKRQLGCHAGVAASSLADCSMMLPPMSLPSAGRCKSRSPSCNTNTAKPAGVRNARLKEFATLIMDGVAGGSLTLTDPSSTTLHHRSKGTRQCLRK